MTPLTDDLKQARQLLDQAERAERPRDRIRGYKTVFAILDKHSEANPDSSHREFIANVKRTYARALIRELPVTTESDLGAWLDHFLLLVYWFASGQSAMRSPRLILCYSSATRIS